MDLIKGLPVFRPEEILPYLTPMDQEYFSKEENRWKLALACVCNVHRLSEGNQLGLVLMENVDYKEIKRGSFHVDGIIFNFRDKDVTSLEHIMLNGGKTINTPRYINMCSQWGIYPDETQEMIVDLYMCSNALRRELIKLDYLFRTVE